MNFFFYLLSSIFLVSCSNTNSQVIENIEVSKFRQLVHNTEGVIIDVRTPKEFHSGHIKDATNIDFYSDNFTEKLNIVRKDIPIYVYCRSGGRSSSAAGKMEKLGFTKVYNLIGGIGSWQLENYETIKSKDFKELRKPIITVSQIDNILANNRLVLIDFGTQWCVPCKKMKPIINEIRKEFTNVKVLLVDADINKELILKYKIESVPTFIVFKRGEETFRNVGIISKEKILEQLN
jgi:thioredoxin